MTGGLLFGGVLTPKKSEPPRAFHNRDDDGGPRRHAVRRGRDPPEEDLSVSGAGTLSEREWTLDHAWYVASNSRQKEREG